MHFGPAQECDRSLSFTAAASFSRTSSLLAALGYPHLTAGFDQKTAPVPFSIDMLHHVVFQSIDGEVRSLHAQHTERLSNQTDLSKQK